MQPIYLILLSSEKRTRVKLAGLKAFLFFKTEVIILHSPNQIVVMFLKPYHPYFFSRNPIYKFREKDVVKDLNQGISTGAITRRNPIKNKIIQVDQKWTDNIFQKVRSDSPVKIVRSPSRKIIPTQLKLLEPL